MVFLGEKTLQKIIQADSNRKSGSNQVFTKRVTDKDSAGNDTGDTQQLHDAHPYMKYLANQISETSKPDSAATTPELSKKKVCLLMHFYVNSFFYFLTRMLVL